MKKIGSDENCSLKLYLKEVSQLDGNNIKAQLAGALLYELDNLSVIRQLTDITATKNFLQQIAEDKQTNLMFELAEKCSHCSHLGNCEVRELFKDVY